MRIFAEINAIFLQTYFKGGRIVLELYYYYMVGGLVGLLSKRSLDDQSLSVQGSRSSVRLGLVEYRVWCLEAENN